MPHTTDTKYAIPPSLSDVYRISDITAEVRPNRATSSLSLFDHFFIILTKDTI